MGPDGAAIPALENPFLIVYGADSEAIYCLPVASKAVGDYVVYCIKSVIDELGYSEVQIALKSDAAPELQQIREQVRNFRTAPTTPIDVPVKETKMNGAVERRLAAGATCRRRSPAGRTDQRGAPDGQAQRQRSCGA